MVDKIEKWILITLKLNRANRRRSNGIIYHLHVFHQLHAAIQFHCIHAMRGMSIMHLIKRFCNNVFSIRWTECALDNVFFHSDSSLSQSNARRCVHSTIPLAYILNVRANTIEYFKKNSVLGMGVAVVADNKCTVFLCKWKHPCFEWRCHFRMVHRSTFIVNAGFLLGICPFRIHSMQCWYHWRGIQ